MKTTRIMLLAAVLLGALPAMGSAATSISAGLHVGPSGHARVDVGFFYDDLASYGHWIERPRYGWVWTPRAVSASWRPYQAGHWVWTDLGWTWVSDEPYGWATYHYGRWYDDPDYGWEWVPGEEWAPAWVDWHEGNDYVGWAPLPPSVDFRPGVELNVSLAPEAFVFVPERNFLDLRVARYAVPRWECERIYRGTRNFTRYQTFNNRVFNAGIPVERVQRFTGRAVPRYQLADQGWNQRHQQRVARNQVAIFRPQVERGARVAAPSARPIARRAVLAGAAATAAVSAHHAFRAEQARQHPQEALRQQERAQRQTQQRAQMQQQQARQQQRLQGRQQRQEAQQQARVQQRQGRTQQQARIQQQQGRAQRQAQVRQQQQPRQLQRSERQQQRAQQHARVEQQQLRSQRQVQRQQQVQARQVERSQRQQQQQARQQERVQRQARAQQPRPQRQFQQAQRQQARQQARQPRQQQGNPGQGQGNHHRQRPPQ